MFPSTKLISDTSCHCGQRGDQNDKDVVQNRAPYSSERCDCWKLEKLVAKVEALQPEEERLRLGNVCLSYKYLGHVACVKAVPMCVHRHTSHGMADKTTSGSNVNSSWCVSISHGGRRLWGLLTVCHTGEESFCIVHGALLSCDVLEGHVLTCTCACGP